LDLQLRGQQNWIKNFRFAEGWEEIGKEEREEEERKGKKKESGEEP